MLLIFVTQKNDTPLYNGFMSKNVQYVYVNMYAGTNRTNTNWLLLDLCTRKRQHITTVSTSDSGYYWILVWPCNYIDTCNKLITVIELCELWTNRSKPLSHSDMKRVFWISASCTLLFIGYNIYIDASHRSFQIRYIPQFETTRPQYIR